jgi:hypothetical protein
MEGLFWVSYTLNRVRSRFTKLPTAVVLKFYFAGGTLKLCSNIIAGTPNDTQVCFPVMTDVPLLLKLRLSELYSLFEVTFTESHQPLVVFVTSSLAANWFIKISGTRERQQGHAWVPRHPVWKPPSFRNCFRLVTGYQHMLPVSWQLYRRTALRFAPLQGSRTP